MNIVVPPSEKSGPWPSQPDLPCLINTCQLDYQFSLLLGLKDLEEFCQLNYCTDKLAIFENVTIYSWGFYTSWLEYKKETWWRSNIKKQHFSICSFPNFQFSIEDGSICRFAELSSPPTHTQKNRKNKMSQNLLGMSCNKRGGSPATRPHPLLLLCLLHLVANGKL